MGGKWDMSQSCKICKILATPENLRVFNDLIRDKTRDKQLIDIFNTMSGGVSISRSSLAKHKNHMDEPSIEQPKADKPKSLFEQFEEHEKLGIYSPLTAGFKINRKHSRKSINQLWREREEMVQ